MSINEQSRRVAEDVMAVAADESQRRSSITKAIDMAEAERSRRILENSDFSRGVERRASLNMTVEMEEAERERRIQEVSVDLGVEEKESEVNRENAIIESEVERMRRLEEGFDDAVSVAWTELNTSLHHQWNRQYAVELEQAEKARRIGEIAAEKCAEMCDRIIARKLADRAMDAEQAELVGEEFSARAMDRVWRSLASKKSIDMEDAEKSRRVGLAAFDDASNAAQRKFAQKLAKNGEEGERSRRMSLDIAFETAELCARKFAEEEVKEEAVEDPGFSQLYNVIQDQLDFYFEEADRLDRRRLAGEQEDNEQTRRRSEALNEVARDELQRFFLKKDVVEQSEIERFRRIGEDVSKDAAEKASSLLNQKLSTELSEMERSRRLSIEAKEDEILAHDLAQLFKEGFLKKLHESTATRAAEIGERRNSKQESIASAEGERARRLSNAAIKLEAPLSFELASLFKEGYQKMISVKAFEQAADIGMEKADKFEHQQRQANIFREANIQ